MRERKLVEKLNKHSRSALELAVSRYTPYVSVVILRALAVGEELDLDTRPLPYFLYKPHARLTLHHER